MADKELRQWLASMQGTADTAKAAASSERTFENPPDGNYIMDLEDAEFCTSQNGRRQIKWVWEIKEAADESWIGKRKYVYNGLEDDRGWEYLFQDLRKMGVDVSNIKTSQLPEIVADLVAFGVRITAQLKANKRNSDFQNMYIKTVHMEEGPDTSGTSSSSSPAPTSVDVGDRVVYKWEGGKVEGTVAQFNPDTGAVTIRSGRATREISIHEVISIV